MKTMNQSFKSLLLVVLAVFTLTVCTKENTISTSLQSYQAMKVDLSDPALNGVDESTVSATAAKTVLYDCINSFAVEHLSAAEISSLNAMREEELLAMDIYTTMYTLYKIPVFNNISKSELQHTTAVKALLDKYGLPDIAANHVTGVYVNTNLQSLYNALLAKGKISLNDALTAGATIEDLDINDLANHISNNVDNADILFVYNNLERGSRNHMRAFYRILQNRGITYVPQYISQEQLTQIITWPHETGSGCRN